LRYPTDGTDEEWSLIGPLIPPAKRGGNKRTVTIRPLAFGEAYKAANTQMPASHQPAQFSI
jgi:transposase